MSSCVSPLVCGDARLLEQCAADLIETMQQQLTAVRIGAIELEVRVGAPVIEETRPKSCAFDALQELLRDDLVRIHVAARQRDGLSPMTHEGPHHPRTSTRHPSIAAAAAMAGLMRWVRPPRPWRPSKLRLDVAAQRSPAPSTSAFIPIHMEQPAVRHSNPASRKTRSNPSRS